MSSPEVFKSCNGFLNILDQVGSQTYPIFFKPNGKQALIVKTLLKRCLEQ